MRLSLLVEILGEKEIFTFLVTCLGCNFPLARKDCPRFVFSHFSPRREKRSQRAPPKGKTHGFSLGKPFSLMCAELRNSAPLLIARKVAHEMGAASAS